MTRTGVLMAITIMMITLSSVDPTILQPTPEGWANVGFPGRNIVYVTVHPANPRVVFIQDSTVFTADMIDPG
jgi:hypothetical protein